MSAPPTPPPDLPRWPAFLDLAQLEARAAALAAEHTACAKGTTTLIDLLAKLEANRKQLLATYRSAGRAALQGRWMSPASEWLLDNFHVVQEQLREGHEDLPKRFARTLPLLRSGPSAGLPRAFAIANDFTVASDGRLDIDRLKRFLAAYQVVAPLRIGELWAIPIALRHALLDRLSILAARVEWARHEREAAADLALELSAAAVRGANEVQRVLAQRVEKRVLPSTTMFATELLLRLRDQDPALAHAASWLERRIEEQGTTLDDAIRIEHQSQAANQLSVGNAITSMRMITATDWRKVFEELSLVERVLRQDPSGHYPRMDFATRDRYRHAIERVAARSRSNELDIADAAVALARQSHAADPSDVRGAHVGTDLVSRSPALWSKTGYVPKPIDRVRDGVVDHGAAFYLTLIPLFTIAAAGSIGWIVSRMAPQWVSLVVAAIALLPCSEVAVGLVNFLVTFLLEPRRLPKLDFSKVGVPVELRTLVAVPTLLTSVETIDELVEALEVRYLANRDAHIHFALLTDFADAHVPTTSADDGLLQRAASGIDKLNAKHGDDRFLLLHRRRVWNAAEGVFMGWERKRGKLVELNRLITGRGETSFETIVGQRELLDRITYVLTLDSDTRLPRDSARVLVGAMAHPLNQPRFGRDGLVVEGHAILQPRVSVSLESSRSSRLARLFSGMAGIDPYTTAVSDVYQDLFGEGSFVGKGIYDVRAFERALSDRVPEHTLLSHDLLEGLFARAGLVSDVELFDDTPSTYLATTLRRHRWIRGDWQLLPWLGLHVPSESGAKVENPLPAIARWKILDNLRRSLIDPATLVLFALLLSTVGGLAWIAIVLLLLIAPVLLHWTSSLLRIPARGHRVPHLRRVLVETGKTLLRGTLAVLFLPYEAWISVDAVTRVLYRRTVSHRGLLEWTTAAQAERSTKRGIGSAYRAMKSSLVLTALTTGIAVHARAWSVLPLMVAWLVAPAIATWLGHRAPQRDRQPRAVDRDFLRRLARRTWRYFERFVTADDHFLPPDNVQEDPPVLARRTSPTNMGLSLVADVVALDLGYIGVRAFVDRVEKALDTLDGLERHHGHFLNWYDTQTCAPLLPRYVSFVDSGNLAAMLLALKQACLQAVARPAHGHEIIEGLVDTVHVIEEELDDAQSPFRSLRAEIADLLPLLDDAQRSPERRVDHLARCEQHARRMIDVARAEDPSARMLHGWLEALLEQVRSHVRDLDGADVSLRQRLEAIAARADALANGMDFTFLFDEEREVFTIGYDVQGQRRDASSYDLLASEARLGSFVAIAKGDVPVSHWYRLGRPLVEVGFERALLSWTGTMFEYLMPRLLLRSYPDTLLDQTCHAVVEKQIAYGRERKVPWGISESAYNARDLHLNYQYGPFGVPGLGIKRGLGDDLVVAPYATALALMVSPRAAVENLWRLGAAGLEGEYGFYESIDYTRSRVREGQRGEIVRAFMAHHQGMALTAIAEHLGGGRMTDRFHTEPVVKATELLLQERIPPEVSVDEPAEREIRRPRPSKVAVHREWRAFDRDATPRVNLLSNGSYSVMITAAGGGYSRCRDIAVTRWREDATRDCWGQFFYVRESKRSYSATFQPTLVDGTIDTCFSVDRAELRREQDELEIHTTIVVSAEDDAEIRTITLTNRSMLAREIEVSSYAEIVLQAASADEAHPAFGNLFVETEHLQGRDALLATRRRRSASESQTWAMHVCATDGETVGPVEYETDRARFIGRGRSPRSPIALEAPLSNSVGAVLDPIFSLRRKVRVPARQSIRLRYTTAIAPTRDAAISLADKYATAAAADRAAALAWTHAQAQLHYLDVDADEAQVFLELAGHLLYASRRLRAREEIIVRNQRGQSGLWAYGISGDLPMLVMRVKGEQHIELLREGLRAHEYFRLRGFAVDLVVLNEHPPSYSQWSQDQLLAIVRSSPGAHLVDKPGGIFVRRTDVMPSEDHGLILAAARVIVAGDRGTLREQIASAFVEHEPPARLPTRRLPVEPAPALAPLSLRFDNGIGGFSKDGREYVMRVGGGKATPAPWCNVIANETFGTLVSERGSGYEWLDNSHENRVTEWTDDAVIDPPTSAIYLRDEKSGAVWTATAIATTSNVTTVRHGQGYSVFEGAAHGIAHELTIFVAPDDPVRISRIVVTNKSAMSRKLSVTGYVEWTIGVLRDEASRHVVTSVDEKDGFVVARNHYPGELGAKVSFVDSLPRWRSLTCDRAEFLGRNGDPADPAALGRVAFSGRTGAGLDPCTATMVPVELAPGESRTISFVMGQTAELAEARGIVTRFRAEGAVDRSLVAAKARWDRLLGALQVETPDDAADLLVNRWLLYQVTSSRLWGRTGFYQSGGAYGFRDQLQDVAALVYAEPALARAQLLRAASKQFHEGDVLHWWHPPMGKGVRTLYSDDYLWLPFIVAHYVETTGDVAVLDEQVAFIEARALEEHEHEAYLTPTISDERASLYEHCMRSLEHATKVGAHGLPLMGCGDWNDGMNRVGIGGKGESVWLAWFLITVIQRMAPISGQRGDELRARRFHEHAVNLHASIEREAWDGHWYLRAFFDDGTPLGSSKGQDCQIDSLAQTWSVISGMGDPARSAEGLASVDERLVDPKAKIVKLLAPPFDRAPIDPGYIKGYIPGVRENGGQYTHAAAWVILAHALRGDGDRAGDLLKMVNPIRHADTVEGVARYRVEPYVVAGDVAGQGTLAGRGGWTWYTGSASWIYRVVVESILGFKKRGDTLVIDPCVPRAWPRFVITYRHGRSVYRIEVDNPNGANRGVAECRVDGRVVDSITLLDDGKPHEVRVTLGGTASQAAHVSR